jgi:hypothetical protein
MIIFPWFIITIYYGTAMYTSRNALRQKDPWMNKIWKPARQKFAKVCASWAGCNWLKLWSECIITHLCLVIRLVPQTTKSWLIFYCHHLLLHRQCPSIRNETSISQSIKIFWSWELINTSWAGWKLIKTAIWIIYLFICWLIDSFIHVFIHSHKYVFIIFFLMVYLLMWSVAQST